MYLVKGSGPFKVIINLFISFTEEIVKQFWISDMMWVHRYDQSERYLIAIHPPHTVVVWDTTTGTKLWKKVYTEQLIMMDIDPFDPIRLACKTLIYQYFLSTIQLI